MALDFVGGTEPAQIGCLHGVRDRRCRRRRTGPEERARVLRGEPLARADATRSKESIAAARELVGPPVDAPPCDELPPRIGAREETTQVGEDDGQGFVIT